MDNEKLYPKDVLQKIKRTGDAEKRFLAHAGRGMTPVVFMPATGAVHAEGKPVEAKVVVMKTPDGLHIATGLSFTCQPREPNPFTVDGNPLTAKSFSFSVGEISWSPGDGLSLNTTYCPYDAYLTDFRYKDAKVNQIVPMIKGQNYFIGCSSTGSCTSPGVGQIVFDVNDNGYADNRGYYIVNVWGWS